MSYNIFYGPLKKNGDPREIEEPPEPVKKFQKTIMEKLRQNVDFEDFSYCRKDKGPKRALTKFEEYRDYGFRWIASIDVKNCFPSIDPDKAIGLLDTRLNIPEISGRDGLPQGHPISPFLANVYLDQWDKKVSSWNDCQVIRYMDDIWLMCKYEEEAISHSNLAEDILADLGLEVRKKVQHVNEGINCLGYIIYQDYKKINPEKIREFIEKVKTLVYYANYYNDPRDRQECIQRLHDTVQGYEQHYEDNPAPWRETVHTVQEAVGAFGSTEKQTTIEQKPGETTSGFSVGCTNESPK
ncbi:hypothetical protein AKJ38_03150 [candidate division MSBL1 archaeon SCGC-AAA259I14]|uniref:Reverse transcriptase domain-containing protein n=3 Tax=candidate division MSBL1 TaxID=215777 RepID=A0A133UQR6_9EURY|nr:hypothetical protein AKJ66_04175 [candidate division MSBL1 archaeon SCGC-AAA259E22]KXA94918.1 hypothetical protein AKJ36_01940 [candidate division MSBL1 archaeon SCGC-AAA259I07]KXA96523.1 hypothetical protein AKJ38_03150 [candidate division MSBL1 archaeon SCGC-AAA259I14]